MTSKRKEPNEREADEPKRIRKDLEPNECATNSGRCDEAGPSDDHEFREPVTDPLQTVKEPLQPEWEPKHKIFLSHSGFQKAFTEHLCERLEAVHHFPFFDRRDDSLRKGERFFSPLMKAVRECRVAVLVLSEEFFTESKWPMMELKEFVEVQKSGNNRLRILPLYFKITREEIVKKMNSEGWKAAWERFKETDDTIDLGAWKHAVSKIQGNNGIEYRGRDEGEPAFIKRVVDAVCKLVPPDLKWDESEVQSKDELCEPILKRLKEVEPVDKGKGKVRVVGLYGVGGVGKTTISRVICNEMYADFGGKVCHVELGSAKDFVELLKMVLRELTEASPDILVTVDHSKLVRLLKERMHRQKVFLVLDNVWDDDIEEVQMYLKAGYHEGSMVLVTSRSVDVLVKQLGISWCDCMEMPELGKEGATDLFLQHTGRSRECIKTDDEWEIVGNCVDECRFGKPSGTESWNGVEGCYHYHPLALKVLGMALKVKGGQSGNMSRVVVEWKESLEKLKSDKFNMLGKRKHPLFSVLRLGYDELREEQQHIFLDLVLIWLPRRWFSGVWFEWKWLRIIHGKTEAKMWEIINALKRQGVVEDVIEVDEKVKLRIHDLYLEFAKAEAEAPRGESNFEKRRFIFVNEESDGPHELEDGNPPNGFFWPALKRLIIHMSKVKSLVNLDHYRNVEVLGLNRCYDLEEVDVTGMDNLRCVVATNCYMLRKWTGLKKLRKLVILQGEVKHLDILDDLPFLTALQVLKLQFMGDFRPFRPMVLAGSVISSMRSLTKLHDLSLMGWHEINDLAGVCELTSLQRVIVCSCVGLSKLNDLRKLTQLEFLDVSYCNNLRSLSGIGHATALRHLNASYCSDLKELVDEDFITLKQLEFLDVSGCRNLTSLRGIGHATALRHLHAKHCFGLKELADEDFITLKQLEFLDVSWCTNLTSLSGIGHATALRHLHASHCWGLQDLAGKGFIPLKQLELLDVNHCQNLTSLSGIGHATALRHLHASQCWGLKELADEDFITLKQLQFLDVRWCTNLMSLSGIGHATALRHVDASSCRNLIMLPTDLSRLEKLEMLDLQEAESLCTVPDECGILTQYRGSEGILKVRVHDCWGLVLPLVKRLQHVPLVSHKKCGDSCSCGCESMQSWIAARKKVDGVAYQWLENVFSGKPFNKCKWRYMLNSDGEVDDILIRALCEHVERMDNGVLVSVIKESLYSRKGGKDVSGILRLGKHGQWWAVVATAPCTFSVVTEKAVLEPWRKTLLRYTMDEILHPFAQLRSEYNNTKGYDTSDSGDNESVLGDDENDAFIEATLLDTAAKVVLLKCKETLEDAIKQGIGLVRCNEGMKVVDTFLREIEATYGRQIPKDSVIFPDGMGISFQGLFPKVPFDVADDEEEDDD